MDVWASTSSDALTITLLGALALMLVWEVIAPYRSLTPERNARWRVNFLLYAATVIVFTLLAPVSLVAVARWSAEHRFGLFNRLAVPAWVAVTLSVLLMDLGKYLQDDKKLASVFRRLRTAGRPWAWCPACRRCPCTAGRARRRSAAG